MLQLASSTSWWTANGEYGAGDGGVKEGEDEDDDDEEEVGAAGVGNEGEERWHVADVVAAGGGPKATSAGV